jgi:hypothetical protein
MSKEVTDIRQAIQALSGFGDLQYEGVMCNVSDIDLATFTCTCTPINGDAEFYDVLLNADADKGFTLIPANGSLVIIQQTSQANAYVTMVSKVDQVYLAGDANGGLVKVTDLTAKLNQLVTQISANFTAIAAIYPYTIVPLTPFVPTDYQNLKVKHGNG